MSELDTDVVILGASFAGVELLYQLVRMGEGRPPRTIVVDRQSQHGYLPLVQERFTGVIAPEQGLLDTKAYVESVPEATFVRDEIVGLDPKDKCVRLGSGREIRARFVVVALGSVVEPPPTIDGAEYLQPYKSEAQFEHAHRSLVARLEGADEAVSVVVVGGGISGVELAGELAALAQHRPQGWVAPKVTLVDGHDRLLPGFHPRIASNVYKALRRQGVEVRCGVQVSDASPEAVGLRSEDGGRTELPCDLAFWAGGIAPAPTLDELGLPTTDAGWLAVGPTLQCFATPKPDNPDIFACGDAVRVQSGAGEWNTMPRAIEAIWQAKVVARNVMTLFAEPLSYPDGVPPLRPHKLRETFFYGISAGATSLVAYRGVALGIPGLNHSFRRWLMRKYFERYRPLPTASIPGPSSKAAAPRAAGERDGKQP